MKAWLDAFNSGDSVRVDGFYRQYQPERTQSQMPFRRQTGGFDLIAIRVVQPMHLEFLVKGRADETQALGLLDLTDPSHVANLGLRALPPGTSAAALDVDAAARSRVIEGAIARLNETYVAPDVAARMADSVRARLKRGAYDSVTSGLRFADVLTQDFQGVSHDLHLRVTYSFAPIPQLRMPPGPDAQMRMRQQMQRQNCAFERVEVMPGNVGYLKFNGFADADICAPTVAAAFAFLAHVDALIVDMRDNGGGSPAMVSLVCSYLFSKRTHLNDLWTRSTNSTEEFWTRDSLAGPRLPDDKPVYVLTSHRTFSGGEEFTYDLQTQKRATIVGETTGGGAHPVSGQRADEHFMIGVPFAKAINPITKIDWEGTGVEPDVKVPAAEALTKAQQLIADRLNPKRG